MASGEVVIQSMWSPAITAVRTQGIPCIYQPLKEGYRAWAVGFALSAATKGYQADVCYEFINWYLSGLLVDISTARVTTQQSHRQRSRTWSHTSGITGCSEKQRRKTLKLLMAKSSRAPAKLETVVHLLSGWEELLAGMLPWTRIGIWFANGMNLSQPNSI